MLIGGWEGCVMGGRNSAASINRYKQKAYDRIGLEVPKGQKEVIQEIASLHGMSVNQYIRIAISEKMARDGDTSDRKAE